MNSYTNYTIIDKSTQEALLSSSQESRDEARDALQLLKKAGFNAVIQQNEYVLKSSKIIR